MSNDSSQRRERQITGDRETIRRWADEHDVVPVRGSAEGTTGRFHIVPEREVSDAHERMEWDAFFDAFEEGDHVVVYHGEDATRPFEVAERDEIVTRLDDDEIEERLLEGETVTSEITETTVVESVITEEITVESELVDTEVIDQTVVDVELLGRECTSYELVDDSEGEPREWFDSDRYLAQIGRDRGTRATGDDREEATSFDVTEPYPYHPELDVEETWSVTRELVEQFTVESRITGTEVTEADSIEDHDIDVRGLHRSIVERGLIEEDLSTEEVLTKYDIESELSEADRIHTSFTRDRTVQNEVVDRKRLRAEVRGGELLDTETVSTREIIADQDVATEETREEVTLTDDEVGKRVVDATGEKIGAVSGVEEENDRIYADTDRGIRERIMSALGWSHADENDYALGAEKIRRITDEQVELKSEERMESNDRSR